MDNSSTKAPMSAIEKTVVPQHPEEDVKSINRDSGATPHNTSEILLKQPRQILFSQVPKVREKTGNAKGNQSIRVPGGNAAVSKPIKADYDEEDGRIIELKLQGYTDKETAQKLKSEGFTNYQDRTIGSRWTRLRKMLEEEDDKKLDDELSDWHMGEDDELLKAYEAIDEKIQEDYQRLCDKRWSQVANILAARLRKKKYSGNACKERYTNLQNGTALKAIELDSDQEGRRIMREKRIAAAKASRAAENAQTHADRLAREVKASQRKQARQEKFEQKASEIQKRHDEKAEKARIKEERRTQQIEAREAKQATLKAMKAERDWLLERNRKEKEVYKRLTGKDLATELKEAREAASALRESDCEDHDMDDSSDNDTGGGLGGKEAHNHETYELREVGHTAGSDPSSQQDGPSSAERSDPDSIVGFGGATKFSDFYLTQGSPKVKPPSTSTRLRFRTPVTKETLQNPRTVMTEQELEKLLVHRGLSFRGRNETHAEMVARLANADWELVVPDLKDLLRDLQERTDGRKEEMIRRLQDANAATSFKGALGVRPTDLDFMRSYAPYKTDFAHVLAQAEGSRKNEGEGEVEGDVKASGDAAVPKSPDVAAGEAVEEVNPDPGTTQSQPLPPSTPKAASGSPQPASL